MTDKIILKGNPMSTQHIYGQSGRIRYMKADAKKLKESYVRQAREQWWDNECISKDIAVYIDIYFGDKRKRDRDNYHKIAMDSLCSIVIDDDQQIQKAIVTKWYDKNNPRYEITIKYFIGVEIVNNIISKSESQSL